MGPSQIALIWGAASAALFSFPAWAGEWEEYKELKGAIVRSTAKRDIPLPRWVDGLDYKRPKHFYDVATIDNKTEKRDETMPLPVADAVASGVQSGPR